MISTMTVFGILAAASPAMAQCLGDTAGWVCVCENSTSNPTICVKWTEGTPQVPFDFEVDFACTGCSSRACGALEAPRRLLVGLELR